MEKSKYTLRKLIDHFSTVARYGAKNGQEDGMYGAAAAELRRLAELDAMIARGELVRRDET